MNPKELPLHHWTRRIWLAGLAALLQPAWLPAQVNISGFVRDSLAGTPFKGASVQLVPSATPWATGRTIKTDSIGRYAFAAVPPGRYLIGFQHPRLDTLGMDAVSRTLDVSAAVPILRADLALPSGQTFVTTLCGARTDSTGAVIGRVLNADEDVALSGGTVVVRWAELRVDNGGIRPVPKQVVVAFGSDGRYVACGVPTDAPFQLQARTGAVPAGDSASRPSTSGEIEVSFPPKVPLVHRNLLIATAPPGVAATAAATTPSGNSRLSGRVIAADGTPVPNARVAVKGTTLVATADSSGAFRIGGIAAGTRALEVTALGYTPMRTSADFRPNRETTITIPFGAKVATLGSVKVTGAAADRSGFQKRRTAGIGYFLDANTIEQRGAMNVAMALQTAPSLRVNGADTQNPGRPRISGRNQCTPTVYMDGLLLRGGLADVDDVLTVRRVGGIEVYANPSEAPPQYASRSDCATILVWTRAYVP